VKEHSTSVLALYGLTYMIYWRKYNRTFLECNDNIVINITRAKDCPLHK